MIKDLYIAGGYKDDALTIEAALVNPADFGLDESLLTFSLAIKGNADIDPSLFSFYITGKSTRYIMPSLLPELIKPDTAA